MKTCNMSCHFLLNAFLCGLYRSGGNETKILAKELWCIMQKLQELEHPFVYHDWYMNIIWNSLPILCWCHLHCIFVMAMIWSFEKEQYFRHEDSYCFLIVVLQYTPQKDNIWCLEDFSTLNGGSTIDYKESNEW